MTKKTISGIIKEEDERIKTTYEKNSFNRAVKAVHDTKRLIKDSEKSNIERENYQEIKKVLEDKSNLRSYLGTHIIKIKHYAQEGRFGLARSELDSLLDYCESESKNLKSQDYVHVASATAYCLDKALKTNNVEMVQFFRNRLNLIQKYETKNIAKE